MNGLESYFLIDKSLKIIIIVSHINDLSGFIARAIIND